MWCSFSLSTDPPTLSGPCNAGAFIVCSGVWLTPVPHGTRSFFSTIFILMFFQTFSSRFTFFLLSEFIVFPFFHSFHIFHFSSFHNLHFLMFQIFLNKFTFSLLSKIIVFHFFKVSTISTFKFILLNWKEKNVNGCCGQVKVCWSLTLGKQHVCPTICHVQDMCVTPMSANTALRLMQPRLGQVFAPFIALIVGYENERQRLCIFVRFFKILMSLHIWTVVCNSSTLRTHIFIPRIHRWLTCATRTRRMKRILL